MNTELSYWRRSSGFIVRSQWSARRVRLRFQRLKVQWKDFLHLVATENQIRIPLVLITLIFALLVVLQQTQLGGIVPVLLQTLLSVFEVILAIYLSIELLISGIKPHAKERINRPEEVVDFYSDMDPDCSDEFIRMTELPGWQEDSAVIDKVPAITEAVPDAPIKTDELQIDLREDEYYPLSDREERIYEPVIDELKDQFVEEGKFNQMKLRPLSFKNNEFAMGTTTFFNNFATNLSPDSNLFKYRTPRQLLHPEVFHPDGTLKDLSETDLPYIASESGMVVARNGEAIFPIRSRQLVIEGMNIGLSFGGSWDKDVVAAKGIHGQVAEELDQEREIPHDMDVETYYLGTTRRLELLGKPDCSVVAIVDGVPEWGIGSREDTEVIVTEIVPDHVTVDGIETLFEHIEVVNKRVLELLIDSPYPPSAGLLYWLYLLNEAANSDF